MRLLLIACMMVVLVGCAGRVEYVDRPVYITKYRTIEDRYLVACDIVPPPPINRYLAATPIAREELWIDTYVTQVGILDMCNQRLEALRVQNQYLHEQYNERIETN